jgi:hypothetical protein
MSRQKKKTVDSAVKSALYKGSTKEHILMFYADERLASTIAPSKLIKVKFEVDTNPPEHASSNGISAAPDSL